MTLEERDLSLLVALQEDPLAPASKLAAAVKQSTPTIISKLNTLKEEKSYYTVIADLKLETLELEVLDVLIEIDNLENVFYFEQVICYHHPFTRFRIRSFGTKNGLYVQFLFPFGSKNLLIELLDYLRKTNRIQDYFIPSVITSLKTIYTKANLASWKPNLMRWSFNWDKWIAKLPNQPTTPITRKMDPSFLSSLDELDFALIEEITKSARRKNTEIMDALSLDKNQVGLPQKVSRKLKFIDKKIVFQYRVFLRWEAFEIYNSFLVVCQCNSDTRYKLQNLLMKEKIPFETTFKITEDGFIWYIRCPASHFSNISEIIWRLSDKAQFYFLDYKQSENYGLWKGAFNSQTNSWRLDLMKKEEVIK